MEKRTEMWRGCTESTRIRRLVFMESECFRLSLGRISERIYSFGC